MKVCPVCKYTIELHKTYVGLKPEYRCSYCSHLFEGQNAKDIYFNEMIEREG